MLQYCPFLFTMPNYVVSRARSFDQNSMFEEVESLKESHVRRKRGCFYHVHMDHVFSTCEPSFSDFFYPSPHACSTVCTVYSVCTTARSLSPRHNPCKCPTLTFAKDCQYFTNVESRIMALVRSSHINL